MEASRQPKLGLALSGGGFRAAFFHLGVLARLAELGLLRRVEVISTVSGGSIVGAAYYLRLKWLLQSRPGQEITDEMYCELVADVADRLRAMVRKNVRGRIFLNPFKNLAMASRRYSRSDRIGDLYDLYLYNPAWEGERPRTPWGAPTQIELRELLIQPPGAPEGFKPDEQNDLLSAKVPILLLNATSLNSGHNWRFEAVRMGEPLPDDERDAPGGRGHRQEHPPRAGLLRAARGQAAGRPSTSATSRSRSRSPPRPACPGSFTRWRSQTSTTGSPCSSSTAASRTTRASRACSTRTAPT